LADPTPSIFLIGYRGSGKSTVGKLIADRLGRRLLDTDRMVEDAAGKSIARCFAEDGEPAFRALESAAIESVCRRIKAGEAVVASTGGGIILAASNREKMRGAGAVVWLKASAAILARRIAGDPASASSRPPLSRGGSSVSEVEEVLRAREALYRDAASIEMSAEGLSPEETADRILSELAGTVGPGRDRWKA
jgi:shikimate kinase